MSEYHDFLNEMKEMEKHPSKFCSEEEKIARGIYCPKCLGSGDKVEIVSGTATCHRCYCIEHDIIIDVNIFQRNIQEMNIEDDVEGIKIGKIYPVNDIIEKIGGCCDMIIGHAVIENEHLYFINMNTLGYNGNKGKNITLLSLINRKMEKKGVENGKKYIMKFILDNDTTSALGRLRVFEINRVYKYVMTDIKEIKSFGYKGMKRDAIKDINDVFKEMKIPYKADNHKKYIKIWRYI